MLHSTIMSHAKENKDKNNFRFKQLQDFEKEIDWVAFVKVIYPHYVSSNIGHLLVPVESMLRVYFLQHRYGMSASGVEDALFQINVMREFALIDLESHVIPNASCIKEFKSLLINKGLASEIKQAFNIQPILTESPSEV